MPRRNSQKGFSLLEMLLIVAFLLIIAAIAIPRFLTIKQQATATAAVSNMRSLNNALAAYNSNYASIGYPNTLAQLGPSSSPNSTAADLVDTSLSTCDTVPKEGYLYTYTVGSGTPALNYTLTGAPQINSAYRYFFTDNSAVIRYSDNSPASATSPPIG